MTVLINVTTFCEIGAYPSWFLDKVVRMILNPDREQLVYWLLLGILLKRN